jgi:proteasome lid subunit RPN8/RPN11
MMLLSVALLRQVERAAQAAYPKECCGLLIGFRAGADQIRVNAVAPSPNLAPSPRDRFEVDPALRFATMCRLRGTTESIIGHYHSHPDGPALPSVHDVAMAFEPELIWLIIAVDRGTPGNVAAFTYDSEGGSFRRVPLTVTS